MCWHVYQGNDKIRQNSKASSNKNKGSLSITENIWEFLELIYLKIDSQYIVNDKAHKKESVERKNIWNIMCFLGPILSEQTPNNTQDYHENIN